MRTFVMTAIAAGAFALAFATAPADAAVVKYKADLSATQEVPATDSQGKGTLDASYDSGTKTLTWTITYSDLSGPATAANFHGPAKTGATAKPVLPLTGALNSPIKGSAKLTKAQVRQLRHGHWYVNLGTAKFPNGEIRGQVVKG